MRSEKQDRPRTTELARCVPRSVGLACVCRICIYVRTHIYVYIYIYIYMYIYIYIYRNAQIGFTSRGLIDVYAAIAPMVERNPIRRAIRESKRSSNASFVESLWLSSLPPSPVHDTTTLFFVPQRPRNYHGAFIIGTFGSNGETRGTILIR